MDILFREHTIAKKDFRGIGKLSLVHDVCDCLHGLLAMSIHVSKYTRSALLCKSIGDIPNLGVNFYWHYHTLIHEVVKVVP